MSNSLRTTRSRRAMVLILVMIVVAMLSLAGFTFSELMFGEYEAAVLHGQALQARVLTDSGIDHVKSILMEDAVTQEEGGGVYDNAERFQGQLVAEEAVGVEPGRFSVIAPRVDQGVYAGHRYGLDNESAKLNLNEILLADLIETDGARNLMMALPGMTEDVADAILDWIDEDDDQREFGAEADYYSGMSPPYAPKNGKLDTVEELLLVRGVTPWLLFGGDANRNFTLEAREQPYAANSGVDNSDGSMTCGWAAYLTLYSAETNLKADGTARINLNSDELETLHEDLKEAVGDEWAQWILLFRQNGPMTVDPAAPPPNAVTMGNQTPDFEIEGQYKFTQVLDLVGAYIQITDPMTNVATVYDTPFKDDAASMLTYLPKLMDNVTAVDDSVIRGRININQAPRTLLLGIPGLEPDVVENIIAERVAEPTENEPERRHETWLLTEGYVTLEEMRQLMPLVTCGGAVHRVQVLGYFDTGGPTARAEAIIDATSDTPGVVFWRDLTHLGRGFPD
jgi:DNA uptake protein ComE-like DNA-binding protein